LTKNKYKNDYRRFIIVSCNYSPYIIKKCIFATIKNIKLMTFLEFMLLLLVVTTLIKIGDDRDWHFRNKKK
jgi:hypothetical protein